MTRNISAAGIGGAFLFTAHCRECRVPGIHVHTAEKEGAGLDIRYLKGVGEKRAAQLARLGIRTVDDLLGFYPRDYVDYSHPYPVAGAPYDVKCVVRATVYGKNGGARIRGGRQMAKATAGDDTAGLILTYFNNPYALQKLEVGREYLFFGKVGGTFTAREMVNPVMLTVESAAASPLVPVYPQTEGVSSAYLAKCVRAAFAAAPDIEEPLPAALIEKYRLCGKAEALQKIHFPQSRQDVQAARRRLIFEELLALQLGLLLLRVDLALVLSALIALVDALPVLGTGTVLVPWALVSLLGGNWKLALGLAVLYGVIWLVRSLLEPRLIGSRVGLPPLAALLSLYVGFQAFGVAGMILAPLLAVLVRQLWSALRPHAARPPA